jgi:hypothetical protein
VIAVFPFAGRGSYELEVIGINQALERLFHKLVAAGRKTHQIHSRTNGRFVIAHVAKFSEK